MPVVVIDSSFATQLQKYVDESIDGHPLWTARFLKNESAHVSAHKDFIKAGSQIFRTNSYQTSKKDLMQHMNITEKEANDLLMSSVKYAKKAIENQKHPDSAVVQIAGSIGPYGACLHDGSEYTGSYCNDISKKEFISWHRWRMSGLIEAGVDLLAIETVPCSREALALMELLKEFPQIKAWLSFSIKNESDISNGENFAKVADMCWKASDGQLLAIGANCCDPRFISPLIDSLKAKNKTIPFIAYPNSGEQYDGNSKQWCEGINKRKVHEFVDMWMDKGVSYVGACCRNDADELAAIYSIVKEKSK